MDNYKMSVDVSEQQDYRKSAKSHAQYKFTRVLPQQAITASNGLISASGGNELTFELPVVAQNLSQSVLQLTITPGAAGGSKYNWMFMDCLNFLQGIQLYTKSGVMICDISNNLHNYTSVVWKAEVKKDDYDNFDLYSTSSGIGRMLRKSNVAAASNLRADGSQSQVAFEENQYFQAGTVNGALPVINVALPLSMIKNTVFEIDKTLYFGEIVVMRLIFSPLSKVLYTGATDNDPSNTPTVATAAANVSNVNLYLAMERNPEVVNILRGEIQKGFSLPIPHVSIFKNGGITGDSQATTTRLSRANGRRLLKIYHAVFGGTNAADNIEGVNAGYNHFIDPTLTSSTVYGIGLKTLYSQLQGVRLSDWNIDLSKYDDWSVMQKKLEGSITLSSNMYRANFFWLDDFSGSEKTIDKEYIEKNQMVGVPLDIEQRYDWFGTFGQSAKFINHYDFCVCQKLLQITPQGITCD